LLGGAAASLAIARIPAAFAQAYPSKNIRVVIPTGQGGGATGSRVCSTISGGRS
jgi:tripartite-type tricarboxylate transporter receptor subunit TctC